MAPCAACLYCEVMTFSAPSLYKYSVPAPGRGQLRVRWGRSRTCTSRLVGAEVFLKAPFLKV
ncbi:Hypothetical predicted protein, partial [Podarcis lilfordi]